MGLTSLHVTNAYHPSSGGIRTFYTALLEAANRERRRVCLVVPGPEDNVEEVGDIYARCSRPGRRGYLVLTRTSSASDVPLLVSGACPDF